MNLDYGLLVPRNIVHLTECQGDIRYEIPFEKPLVLSRNGDIEGRASGGRAALVRQAGQVYKIKGCAIEQAFEDEIYKAKRGDAPRGGQTTPDVLNELRSTQHIRKTLEDQGFPFPYQPLGMFDYEKEWEWQGQLWPLGASVFEVKGDTRLPEIYLQRQRSAAAAFDVAFKFGVSAGAQKKVSDDYYWGGDAHLGNYVVFTDDKGVQIAMVDFENISEARGRSLWQKTHHKLHRWQIPFSLWYAGFYFQPAQDNPWLPSSSFRRGFRKGFTEGWKNPDRREQMTLEELTGAFDLSKCI